MILCIDIGNSRIKLGLVHGDHVHGGTTVSTGAKRVELDAALKRVLRGVPAVEAAVLCSVRPSATRGVSAAVARVARVRALEVTHRTPLAIELAVRKPARVGMDRVSGACGALPGRRRSVITVDAGTAITVNLVLNRRFVGGVIMAGPSASLAGLAGSTARLPLLDYEKGPVTPRRMDDTESAMRWGATLSAAGGIGAAVAVLETHARRTLPVVVTGGHMARLAQALPAEWEYQPHLTLLGLAAIANHNS